MQIDYICLSRVSLRIAAGHSLKAVPRLRREARDDIPGGNPKTAIAGLFPLLHSEVKAITATQGSSVQKGTLSKPRARTARQVRRRCGRRRIWKGDAV